MFKKIVLPVFALLLVVGTGFSASSAFANDDFPPEGELLEENVPDWFLIAADALKMDEDALWEALESGQSLADLAKAQGVVESTITDAIVKAETDFINELVKEGDLTEKEANEWLVELKTELKEEIASFLNESWDWEEFEGVDWFLIAADALKMEEDALWEGLESGKRLAELAKAQGVAESTITDAIVKAETDFINGMVSEGDLTRDEADEWLAGLNEEVTFFLNESWDWDETE